MMAEHRQFYLEDDGAEGDSGEVWTGSALENHLGAVPGLVAIGTGTQDTVPILIEVWDAEPDLDVDGHDHVAETSLEVRSGTLLLAECMGNDRFAELTVNPGWYRIRVSFDRLDTSDDLDHQDSYRCQLWPAPKAPDRVLKWFEGWAPDDATANPYGLRVMTGARAWDERLKMSMIGIRDIDPHRKAFLYRDTEGAYWEYGFHGKTAIDLLEIPASEIFRYEPYPSKR